MEKYRKFADPGTGINPFLPAHAYSRSNEPAWQRCIRELIYVPLLVLRLPLLFALTLVLAITDILFMVPVISAILVRPILRPMVCWLILLCCGVICSFSPNIADIRRLKMRKGSVQSDIVVTDFHGFIDILVHAVGSRPSAFVFQKDGKFLVCFSVLHALSVCVVLPPKFDSGKSNYPSNSVMFLTHIPTNGCAMLKVGPFPNRPHHMSVIDYSHCGSFGAHHLTGSAWSHVFNLMLRNWYVRATLTMTPFAVETADISVFARLYPACVLTELDGSGYEEFLRY